VGEVAGGLCGGVGSLEKKAPYLPVAQTVLPDFLLPADSLLPWQTPTRLLSLSAVPNAFMSVPI
jgi:hypothetical protein